jgi:hypothetical protein
MITGVILNWKRPLNVERILHGWRVGGLVAEAIVWNNNPDAPFRHDWAKVVNAGQDLGLYTRFAAACLAQHACVLIQDDDLELPTDSLRQLYAAWQRDPEVLHGIFGRGPKPDGSYAQNLLGDMEVPIVLTRMLLASRHYAAQFFEVAPTFDRIQRDGSPIGNGEDILFSYVVRRESGSLNRVHRIPVHELPAPHSIHIRYRNAHVAHRTRLMRACEEWLSGMPHQARHERLNLRPRRSGQADAAGELQRFGRAAGIVTASEQADGLIAHESPLESLRYLRRGFSQGGNDYVATRRRRGWWKVLLPLSLMRVGRKWFLAVCNLLRDRRRENVSLAELPAAIAFVSAYYASYAAGNFCARFRWAAQEHEQEPEDEEVITLPFAPRHNTANDDAANSAQPRRKAA